MQAKSQRTDKKYMKITSEKRDAQHFYTGSLLSKSYI